MSSFKNYDIVTFNLREGTLLEIVFNYSVSLPLSNDEKKVRQISKKEAHNFSLALKIEKDITIGGQRLSDAIIKKFISHFASRQSIKVQYSSIVIRTPDVSLRSYLSEPISGTHKEAELGRLTCKVQRNEQPTLITHIEEVVKFTSQQSIDFLLPFIKPGTLTIPLNETETLECAFCGFSTQNRYVSSKTLGIFETFR